jgi:AdoMet-dependent heme synthase
MSETHPTHSGVRPGQREKTPYEIETGVKPPRLIAWEITRRCNLSCIHCRAGAEDVDYQGELSTEEALAFIDDVASFAKPILILTGGEPLYREDIWELITHAREKGLTPVIGTNATLITDEIARKMHDTGITRISVSIDFPTADEHDGFRRQPGCFEQSLAGIKIAQEHGVDVQINTTVTKLNAHRLEDMLALTEKIGAVAFHIFMLVPTGRGSEIADQELPPEEYERVLNWAYDRSKDSKIHFKPTDAPHYYRIIRQRAKEEGREVTAETYGFEALTRGCLGGITFGFVSHVGDVQPCGYFDMPVGNIREQSFKEIWTNAKVFQDLRDFSKLKGKCGACEYKGACGGCRARALAATGDYMAEEPYCVYEPKKLRKAGGAA